MSNERPNVSMSISKKSLRTLAQIWCEMNAIKARDGAPDGVDPAYWHKLMDDLNYVVFLATGQDAWLNPILYYDYKQRKL